MRATLVTMLILPGLLIAPMPAGSDDSKTAEAKPFTLPPGFHARKRGKFVLYCRKEDVIGTRFHAEKCYDKDGIDQLMLAQREERAKLDQARRICSQPGACGGS